MTTLRLTQETKERLNSLKHDYGARSMEELLSRICDAYDFYRSQLVNHGEIMEDDPNA